MSSILKTTVEYDTCLYMLLVSETYEAHSCRVGWDDFKINAGLYVL